MTHRQPHWLITNVLACGLLAYACAASAQRSPESTSAAAARGAVGTFRVEAVTESADGVLDFCGLVFSAMQRDRTTNGESYVMVSGSFNVDFSPKVGPTYLLKLGAVNIPDDAKQPPIRPANAFVRAPNGKVPKNAFREDAERGYAMFGGSLSDAAIDVYRGIIDSGILEVGFNREAGGRDVTVVLDLTVAETKFVGDGVRRQHSNAAVTEFARCSARLFEDAEANLKKK